MSSTDHERFHIRYVDEAARCYRFHTSDRTFLSACYVADAARAELGGDWIVIDSHSNRILYDSRALSPRPQ